MMDKNLKVMVMKSGPLVVIITMRMVLALGR